MNKMVYIKKKKKSNDSRAYTYTDATVATNGINTTLTQFVLTIFSCFIRRPSGMDEFVYPTSMEPTRLMNIDDNIEKVRI